MKRSAVLLTALLAAGALRPALRHDCAPARRAAAAPSCHAQAPMSCHGAPAPAPRDCAGMACCLVREDRAAVAGLSAAPARWTIEPGTDASAPAGAFASPAFRFASSPAPPGAAQDAPGFTPASPVRGPPARA